MTRFAPTLQAALGYTGLGYPVLPCAPDGKYPLIKQGLRAASADIGLIEAWWRQWPQANLAVLPPEDVLVLDFDDGIVAKNWFDTYPELHGAPRARTPRGGIHLWIKLNVGAEGEPLKTRVKAAGGAVDLRGLGRAYLVVPPSSVANSAYYWELELVRPLHLPAISETLLKAISPPPPIKVETAFPDKAGDHARRYALAALRSEHDLVAATAEGARNDRLNRAAYALGGYAALELLTVDEIESVLMAAAQTCGLPDREAARTIQSGLNAGCLAPRPMPTALLERES